MTTNSVRNSITQSASEYVVDLLKTRLPDQYVYHTIDRTTEIVQACEEIGEAAGLKPAEMQTVALAAWFLYSGFVESDIEQSSNIAAEFLRSKRYSAEGIKKVVDCIQAVVPVQNPQDPLGEVLCDAENLHLAKKRYFEKSDLLRVEMERIAGKPMDDLDWIQSRIQKLSTEPFRTAYARDQYGRRRAENLVKAQDDLRQALVKQEAVNARAARNELLRAKLESAQKPARGVDMMFRVMNRNNMTLNVLADRKANMMIHTNAIILSITIGVLVRNLDETPHLVVPTVILVASSLATIVIATLATRPNIKLSQSPERRMADLLFFGNFFKMDFKEYEAGMNEMISKGDFVYGSLIKDTYNIGQVLGRKYRYIRACYDVFMYGLIVSILSFGVAYFFHR
jgi:hypothetical protein